MAVSTRTRSGNHSRPTRTVRSSSRSARSSNATTVPIWLFGVGAVLLVILGFAIGSRTGGGDAEESAAPQAMTTTTAALATPGPKRYDAGIPVGFERSARGAEAAAVSFTQTGMELLALSKAEADAGFAKFTTATGYAQVVGDFETVFTQVRKSLVEAAIAAQQPGSTATAGGAGFLHYTPVATRVVSYTNMQAVLEVWGLAVVAIDGAPVPEASWGTETITVIWDEAVDDWRVDTWASVPGPTPVWTPLVATPTPDFLQRIVTFSPLRATPRN